MRSFIQGRKSVFSTLQTKISNSDQSIWFHCASLGEFEQGVPIIEEIKKLYPSHKIVISFFSPSGYEVKKDSSIAQAVVYLPMDTLKNAKRFVDLVHPSLVFFVKNEIWPNYLQELKQRNIPTILISGFFTNKQAFFKKYGFFMRKALRTFDHLFVQDQNSKQLLDTIGIENSTIAGDTRFDRVSHQIEIDNSLSFMKLFKNDALCIVCGSTWPEDEIVLLDAINSGISNVKFVLAPHKIDSVKIEKFRNQLQKKSILYSNINPVAENDLSSYEVLIVDTIGLLTKIYSYADIAYVGGAMGDTGLHNILEPATFGVPIIIGKNYESFPEAKKLRQLAGLFVVENPRECTDIIVKLVTDSQFRNKTGMIAEHFINSNTGATQKIIEYVRRLN